MLGLVVPALVAVLTPALPVQALSARPVSVTIALTPPNASALSRLALSHSGSPLQRRRALNAVAPTTTSRAHVIGWLRGHGFRVGASDGWSVQATGPRAAALLLASTASPLRADVQAVLGLDNGPVWRHAARRDPAYTSGDFRTAYAATDPTQGAGATVATVEFSGWRESDLTYYAGHQNLPQPTVTTVPVDRADPTAPGRNQGDFEVTLDQEALLNAAPKAAQVVYVGPNSDQGAYDTWRQIADDVAAGKQITAVSTSWGNCEQFLEDANVQESPTSNATTIDAIETQLARLNALGVTVFAASGDLSAYDCGAGRTASPRLAVDFPASSPYAVAVGGTSLRRQGTGWSESAWGATTIDGVAGDGSGGGISGIFPRPDWQRGVGAGLPDRRLVPDISGDADPARGLPIYWSNDPDFDQDNGWSLGGGTSLSAPLQAGLFVSTLSDIDRQRGVSPVTGIGDIHAALYADPSALRDVTTGTNHGYAAGPGYDLVTGLGSPLWSKIRSRLTTVNLLLPLATRSTRVPISAVLPPGVPSSGATWASGQGAVDCSEATDGSPQPVPLGDGSTVVGVAAQTPSGCLRTTQTVVRDTVAPTGYAHAWIAKNRLGISWGGHDVQPSSGLASFHLKVIRVSDGHVVYNGYQTAPGWMRLSLRGNRGYRLVQTAYDNAGNHRTVASGAARWLPGDDSGLARSAGWSRVRAAAAFGGSYLRTRTRGARIGRTLTGRRVVFYVHKDRRSGYADLYVDGRPVRRLNLYSATTRWMVPITVGSFARAHRHRYSLHVEGRHSHRSRGSYVGVDAFVARTS